MLDLTLGATRVAVLDVLLLEADMDDEGGTDVAAADEDVGWVLDAVKTALLFRVASLRDEEGGEFRTVPEIGVPE